MTRVALWLWPVSVLSAVAFHGGLALLLSGSNAQAAVEAPELRITISAAPSAGVAAVPTASAIAVAVPAATAVPIPADSAQPVEVAHAEPVAPPAAAVPVPVPAAGLVAPVAAQPAVAPVLAGPGQQAARAGETASSVAVSPPIGNAAPAPLPVAIAPVATPPNVAAAIGLPTAAAPVAPVAAGVPDMIVAAVPPAVVAASTAPAIATAAAANLVPIITASSVAASAPAISPLPAPSLSVAASAIGTTPAAAATLALPVQPAQVVISTAPDIPAEQPAIVASVPDDVVVMPVEPDGVPTPDALDRFLAGYDGGNCFAASVVRGETAMLTAFAQTVVDSVALQLALGEAFTETVDIDGYRVATQQCGALAFVSGLQRSAAAAMTMALASQSMADGARLTGRLAAPSGQSVYLFVVDDEGVVSDAGAYLAGQGADMTFSVPVHLTGDAEARTQLLIAVSTDVALDPAPGPATVDAGTFFADLAPQLAGSSTSVAIDAFVVH